METFSTHYFLLFHYEFVLFFIQRLKMLMQYSLRGDTCVNREEK